MNNGGVPRVLRSELIYAAAAANAWLRGLPLPTVALHYRYEPVTALQLIRRCCLLYRRVNVEPFVLANVLERAMSNDVEVSPPLNRWRSCASGEAGTRKVRD